MPRGVYLRPKQKREQAAQVKKLPFVEEVLAERGKRYGRFKEHAEVTQQLKVVMRGRVGWLNLTPEMREALDMIQHKIGRIINGDPMYKDSWVDIAGYATLISERLS